MNFLDDSNGLGTDPPDTNLRLIKFDEGNSGSNQFDVIHTLNDNDACYEIGENCPWDSSYGKVRVFGRAYALNAIYDQGNIKSSPFVMNGQSIIPVLIYIINQIHIRNAIFCL